MRRWASSSLEAGIPVVERLSAGTGSMHPESSSSEAAVWEMKIVSPTRYEMLPKKESTSPRSTVYRPTARISARTSPGSSSGPGRKASPGEEDPLPQHVQQVLDECGVEDAGVVDVRLLQRHRTRGDDAHPFRDHPFPVRKERGDRAPRVGGDLLTPRDRDVVKERSRLRIERDDRSRTGGRPAPQEHLQGEGRRG